MPANLGKLRHLQQISREPGVFTIVALDHRTQMVDAIRERGEDPSWDRVAREKERLTRVLARHASGVVLDPIYSAGPVVAAGALPGNVGLLVALEEAAPAGASGVRATILLENWSVRATKLMGASAVKLLLPYHPQAPNRAEQEALVAEVARDCQREDIVFLLEPISYPVRAGQTKSDPSFARERPEIVVESARRLAPLGVDLLKVEFPGDATDSGDPGSAQPACRALTDALSIPWVLLSAGVDYPTYEAQVQVACQEGASGFVAGRAVWKEAVSLPPGERDRFLETTAVARLQALSEIARDHARPWPQCAAVSAAAAAARRGGRSTKP